MRPSWMVWCVFVLGPSSLYPASRTKPGHGVVQHPGRLPERPMGADCKSVGLRLRRFESCTCHPGQRVFRPLWTGLGTGPVRSGSAVASAAASKAVATASSDGRTAGSEVHVAKAVMIHAGTQHLD